jgi:hypothetical protein
MIVKSPLKEKKTRPNLRRVPTPDNGSNGKGFRKDSAGPASYGRRINSEKKKKRLALPKVKPWKVILGAFAFGAFGLLYLNHVFATQELLREVQRLEREYNQARRMHSDYKLMYDRLIGPAAIYEKAKEQGFINGGPAEKIIEVEKP